MPDVLSESTFQAVAQPALHRVFIREDPYAEPFAPVIQHRRLLFEYMYEMETPLLDAVIRAAKSQGEHGFYVSIYDRPPEAEQQQPYHWYISFAEIGSYHLLVGPLTNFVYSPHGSWGIMATYEHFGLLGGNEAIITSIAHDIPDLDSQVFEFLRYWEWNAQNYSSVVNWVPGVLRHIYGRERANKLLQNWDPNPSIK
ncbi:hypothetical protein HC928_17015 [bacterium]|nr:hypothetical protein [bacterium]